MTLVIDGIEVKEVPVKPAGIAFDKEGKKDVFVDSSGRRVQKVKLQGSEYQWVYEDDGSVCETTAYKALKGKPIKPFSKTAVISKYDIIDKSDMSYFINNDLSYLLVSQQLKSKLKELKGKAISFKYVNRGFKVYRAVAFYDDVLDRSFMRCFQGDLRKLELKELEDVKEIEENEADSLSLDDLEV